MINVQWAPYNRHKIPGESQSREKYDRPTRAIQRVTATLGLRVMKTSCPDRHSSVPSSES